MTKVKVAGKFDMDAVARIYPGKLRFRGAPASRNGTTEILGDVPKSDLLAAVHLAEYVPDRKFPWRLVGIGAGTAAAVQLLNIVF